MWNINRYQKMIKMKLLVEKKWILGLLPTQPPPSYQIA